MSEDAAPDFDALPNPWGVGGPEDQTRLERTAAFIREHAAGAHIVVECGALRGALTARLLDALPAANLHLVEVDPEWAASLRERFAIVGDRVTVHEADMRLLPRLPVPEPDVVLFIECLYYLSEDDRQRLVDALPPAKVIVASPVDGTYFTAPQLREVFSGYRVDGNEETHHGHRIYSFTPGWWRRVPGSRYPAVAAIRARQQARRRFQPPPQHVAQSQSDEAEILSRLVEQLKAPRSFLEFGFSPEELNCASLLHTCRGLLVDGDARNVDEARQVMPRKVEALQLYLDLENLHLLSDRYRPGKLGVLSIDVDGNDYWLLEALLPRLEPAVAVVEYNASLGLRPLTVPYDPKFDRFDKHPSGLHHGASLEALTRLAARYGYRLVAVSKSGNNAFYARKTIAELPTLEVAEAYREEEYRNQLSGTTAAEQWERIKDLPYVTVD